MVEKEASGLFQRHESQEENRKGRWSLEGGVIFCGRGGGRGGQEVTRAILRRETLRAKRGLGQLSCPHNDMGKGRKGGERGAMGKRRKGQRRTQLRGDMKSISRRKKKLTK